MNKQELIEKIEALPDNIGLVRPHIDKKMVLGLVRQLDEPQKVVVPQFVAEWYEENKDVFEANLYRYAYNIPSVFDSDKLNEFERWFLTAGKKPFQTLVNMHQFGYEVEKEPKYTVKIKATKHYFAKDGNGRIYFSLKYESAFTKIELEKVNLGWVFDCEGIEVKEVE